MDIHQVLRTLILNEWGIMENIPNDIKDIVDRIDRQGDWRLLPNNSTPKNKYDGFLQDCFPNFVVVNITEFDYGRSFRYSVTLSQNPEAASLNTSSLNKAVRAEGEINQLLIAFSAISSYVDVKFVSYTYQRDRVVEKWSKRPINNEQATALGDLSVLLKKEKLILMDPDVAATILPDIETDLKNKNEATVGDCLFYG